MNICFKADQAKGPFILPELPFSKDSFGKYISSSTFDFHHGKHHNTYVTNLNNLLKDSALKDLSLESIILKSANNNDLTSIFNNAAQIWNHSFFWHSIRPNGGSNPIGEIAHKIDKYFGTYNNFRDKFIEISQKHFGSGWVWLVLNQDKTLSIEKTINADNPFVRGQIPLLVLDLWEHAYYLDYQNRRADFVVIFLDNLINWDHANEVLNIHENK